MKTAILILCICVLALPSNAQWIKAAQKDGGYLTSLEVSTSGITLFSALGSRVFRSVDGGNRWSQRNVPTNINTDNSTLTTSMDSSGVIEAVFLQVSPDSVYRSINEGQDWTLMTGWAAAFNNENISSLYGGWRNGNLFVVTSKSGQYTIWKSGDNGTTFSKFASAIQNRPTLYQSHDTTLYVTSSGSASRISTSGVQTSMRAVSNIHSVQEFSGGPVTLYAFLDNKVSRSVNKGDTWTQVHTGLPDDVSKLSDRCFTRGREGDIYLYTRVGNDSTTIYRIFSGASTWNAVRSLNTVLDLPLSLPNGSLVAIYGEGIMSSEEGGQSWIPTSRGIESYPLSHTVRIDNNSFVTTGFIRGQVFATNTGGLSWAAPALPNDKMNGSIPNSIFRTRRGNIIVCTKAGIAVSNDQGFSYTPAQLNGTLFEQEIYSVIELGTDTLLGVCRTELVRSFDRGSTWASYTATPAAIEYANIAQDANTLYFGTTDGLYSMVLGSSQPVIQRAGLDGKTVYAVAGFGIVAAVEREGQAVYKVFLHRRSSSSGTFEQISIPYSSPQQFPTIGAIKKDKTILVTSSDGLFQVPENSTTPSRVQEFGNEIPMFISRENNNVLAASTIFGGIWVDSSGITSVRNNIIANEQPLVYPNPSDDHIIIRCNDAVLGITVRNHFGVSVLSQPAGGESAIETLGISSLAQGTYTAEISTVSGIVHARFIVLR
ncbi:MAG: T9SS type A sorting domain-containing protein [Candidatus Kapabacteria bacterium]|nr:T9SS type A sorting domain-containing protein [Candidatus Kapabacteria bacterium]